MGKKLYKLMDKKGTTLKFIENNDCALSHWSHTPHEKRQY